MPGFLLSVTVGGFVPTLFDTVTTREAARIRGGVGPRCRERVRAVADRRGSAERPVRTHVDRAATR